MAEPMRRSAAPLSPMPAAGRDAFRRMLTEVEGRAASKSARPWPWTALQKSGDLSPAVALDEASNARGSRG